MHGATQMPPTNIMIPPMIPPRIPPALLYKSLRITVCVSCVDARILDAALMPVCPCEREDGCVTWNVDSGVGEYDG